ncbi:MAG: hypothetical protein U0414_17530 [Polyangiaceae bacterium]
MFTLALCALALPASACLITVTDDGTGGTGGGTSSSTTATTSTTTTTSSTTSSTGDTSSSSSGMPVCNDPAAPGSGLAEAECDMMANFPKLCDDNTVPVGIDACHVGFGVFAARGWEVFQGCLKDITATPAETCDAPAAGNNVKACVQKMYDSACPNPTADKVCDDTNDACVAGGENNFDTAACKADLLAFGLEASGQASGLQRYHDCINANLDTPCDQLHTTCRDLVLSGN